MKLLLIISFATVVLIGAQDVGKTRPNGVVVTTGPVKVGGPAALPFAPPAPPSAAAGYD